MAESEKDNDSVIHTAKETLTVIKEISHDTTIGKMLNNPIVNTITHPIVRISESIEHGHENYHKCVNEGIEKLVCATGAITGTISDIAINTLGSGMAETGAAVVATGSALSATAIGILPGLTEIGVGGVSIMGGTYLALHSRDIGDNIYKFIIEKLSKNRCQQIDFKRDIIIKDIINNKVYKLKPDAKDILIYNMSDNVHNKSIILRDKIQNNEVKDIIVREINNDLTNCSKKLEEYDNSFNNIIEVNEEKINIEEIFKKYICEDKYFETKPVHVPNVQIKFGGNMKCGGGGGGGSGFCFFIVVPIITVQFGGCVIC